MDARDKDANTTMDAGLWLALGGFVGHSIQKQAISKESDGGGDDEVELEAKEEEDNTE